MGLVVQNKSDIFIIKTDFSLKNTVAKFHDGLGEKINDIFGGFRQVKFFPEVGKNFIFVFCKGNLWRHDISPFCIWKHQPY